MTQNNARGRDKLPTSLRRQTAAARRKLARTLGSSEIASEETKSALRGPRKAAELGDSLLEDGRIREAIAALDSAQREWPTNRATRRALIRALSASQGPDDVERASELIEEALSDDTRPADINAAIEHAIAVTERYPLTAEQLGKRVALVDHRDAPKQIQRLTNYWTESGRTRPALDLLTHCVATVESNRPYALALHALLVQVGRHDDAEALIAGLPTLIQPDDDQHALLSADRAISTGDWHLAIDTIQGLKPSVPRAESLRLIAAWTALGEPGRVVEFIDETRSGLTTAERFRHLFDAHWVLGQAAEAKELLEENSAISDNPHHVQALEWAYGSAVANEKRKELVAAAASDPTDVAAVQTALVCCAALNMPAESLRLVHASSKAGKLAPALQIEAARAHYALRDFDSARELAEGLDGTSQTWASHKLLARIELELGNFARAAEIRRNRQRPGEEDDEALFHALLSLGEHDEAFRMEPNRAQLSMMRAALGGKVETRPLDQARHRVLIADAGPGDEIQDATLYALLAERSDTLTVTCEPRLASLFRRSFPDIDFIAVDRHRPGSFGTLAPSAPERAKNTAWPLATAEAMRCCLEADAVALGRSTKTLRSTTSLGPSPGFLLPDPALQRKWELRFAQHERPIVGMVWRSELQSMMRNIHYLEPDSLRTVLSQDVSVVVLQHDATSEERAAVADACAHPVVDLNDIDLRNDFEETAAMLSQLNLVVGIGTTITNLAAAVGTKTVMAQPTHFGTWLGDTDHQHFWYQSCKVVHATPPTDRTQLSQLLGDAVAEAISSKDSSP